MLVLALVCHVCPDVVGIAAFEDGATAWAANLGRVLCLAQLAARDKVAPKVLVGWIEESKLVLGKLSRLLRVG